MSSGGFTPLPFGVYWTQGPRTTQYHCALMFSEGSVYAFGEHDRRLWYQIVGRIDTAQIPDLWKSNPPPDAEEAHKRAGRSDLGHWSFEGNLPSVSQPGWSPDSQDKLYGPHDYQQVGPWIHIPRITMYTNSTGDWTYYLRVSSDARTLYGYRSRARGGEMLPIVLHFAPISPFHPDRPDVQSGRVFFYSADWDANVKMAKRSQVLEDAQLLAEEEAARRVAAKRADELAKAERARAVKGASGRHSRDRSHQRRRRSLVLAEIDKQREGLPAHTTQSVAKVESLPEPPTTEERLREMSSALDALALRLDDNMHSLDVVKYNLAEEKRLEATVDESSLVQALKDQVATNAAQITELATIPSSSSDAPPVPLDPCLREVYVQFVSRVGSILDAIFLLDTGLVAKGSSTLPGASKLNGALHKLGDKAANALTAAGGPALALLGLGVRGVVAYARSSDRAEWKKSVDRLRAHWPADTVQREKDLRKAGVRVAREWGEYSKNVEQADRDAFVLEAVDAAVVGLMKEPLLGKMSPEETLRRALDDRTTEAYGAVSAEMYGELDPGADEAERLRRDLMRGPKKTLVNSFVAAMDRLTKLEEEMKQLKK